MDLREGWMSARVARGDRTLRTVETTLSYAVHRHELVSFNIPNNTLVHSGGTST